MIMPTLLVDDRESVEEKERAKEGKGMVSEEEVGLVVRNDDDSMRQDAVPVGPAEG